VVLLRQPDYRIRYAESLDGIAWERAPIDLVLGPSPAPAWDDMMVEYPEIQIVDGTYRMWFCGNGYGSVGYAQGIPETGVDVSVRSGATQSPHNHGVIGNRASAVGASTSTASPNYGRNFGRAIRRRVRRSMN